MKGAITNWQGKRGDLKIAFDTILPFVDGKGGVTNVITIGAIAAVRGHPTNTWDYAGGTVVKCLVPEPVANWTGKVFSVAKVLVKEEGGEWILVTLKKAATIKLARGKPAMQPHLMDFAKRDIAREKTVSDGTARNDIWKKGAATGEIGGSLRRRLEVVPVDSEELIVFASENCVGPAMGRDQERVAAGCFLARNKVVTFKGQLQLTFGGTTQAEANRDAGVWSIACALDHLKGELDDSPIFNGLSDELQDAARKARAGEPWKDQNLDRYLVRVLSDREKAALDQYLEKCRRLGRTPRVGETLVAPSEKSWDDANKREGRGRHSRVRLSVELEH